MQKNVRKKKKAVRRLLCVFSCFIAFVLLVLLILQIGMDVAHTWKPYVPDYEKQDILPLLEKTERSDEDYETLYRQTGLTRLGIDGLLAKGSADEILEIQKDFFGAYDIESKNFAPFVCWEKLANGAYVHTAVLEDGDVFVSSTTHFSFFRAMVVDGERKRLLSAVGYDAKSELEGTASYVTRPAFLILRAKADESIRKEVAAYATENLLDLKYSLTVGIFGKKYDEENIRRTHCAHIVWYAFKRFGIDIDADGGAVVSPKDLANSPNLELVQAYGFDLDTLWR